MAQSATFEEVVKLADQLNVDEQQALIEHLQAEITAPHKRTKKRPTEILTVFEVGAWPKGMTLRREDEYGDDER